MRENISQPIVDSSPVIIKASQNQDQAGITSVKWELIILMASRQLSTHLTEVIRKPRGGQKTMSVSTLDVLSVTACEKKC